MTDDELRLARQPGGLISLVTHLYPQVTRLDLDARRAYDADGREVVEATRHLRSLLPKGVA